MPSQTVELVAEAFADPESALFMAHMIVALGSAHAVAYLGVDLYALGMEAKLRLRRDAGPARSALFLVLRLSQEDREDLARLGAPRLGSARWARGSARAFALSALCAALACAYVLIHAPGSPEDASRAGLLPLLGSMAALAFSVAATRLGAAPWTRRAAALLDDPEFAGRVAESEAREFARSESSSIHASADHAAGAPGRPRRL